MTNVASKICRRAITMVVALIAIHSPVLGQVYSALYLFGSHSSDVMFPGQPLGGTIAQGRDGRLYGSGGMGGTSQFYGGVFRVSPNGTEKVLYSFQNDTTGAGNGVMLGTDGNFYGAAGSGGPGQGRIYKVTPSGTLTSVHDFTAGLEGGFPFGTPVQATDGNFYGATTMFGQYGFGGVYKLTPSGTLSLIAQFDGQYLNAYAPLIQA